MSKQKKQIGSSKEQHETFIKAARELGTDERDEVFDKILKRITSAPPPESVQKRKADKGRRKR